MYEYFLKPGDLMTTTVPAKFTTVLGSCISVCLFDRVTHRAGMTHFIFSEDKKYEGTDHFGDVSTVHLIEYMLKNGCSRNNIVASLIGGASSFQAHNSETAGQKNIRIAREVLRAWNIKPGFEDLGGCHGRKVVFLTDTNELSITELDDCLGMCKREGKVCPNRIKAS